MLRRRGYFFQLASYSLVLLITTYGLALGGTFNGLVNVSLRQASLLILAVGAGLWLLVVWLKPRTGTLWSPLAPALVVWGAVYLLSLLHNPTSRVLTGTWYAGLYGGLWLLLVDLRQRGLPGRWLIDAILFVTVPVALIAQMQVVTWFPRWWDVRDLGVAFIPPRAIGIFGNSNVFGTFLAVALPLGWVRVRTAPHSFGQWIWRLWTVFILWTLYLTFSRGAWLAAGAGLGSLWLLVQRGRLDFWRAAIKRRLHWRSIGFGAALVAGLVVVAILIGPVFDTPRRDVGPRLTFYRIAWDVWRAHPLLGSGPFTYGLQLQEVLSIPGEQPHSHAHNLVLNVMAETGLMGLGALILTVGIAGWQGWRRLAAQAAPVDYAQQAACCAALVALGTHTLFDMTLIMPAVMVLGIMVLAVCIVSVPQKRVVKLGFRWSYGVFAVSMLALWGVVLATGWWSTQIYARYIDGERLLIAENHAAGAAALHDVAEQQSNVALYWAEYGYACGLVAAADDLVLAQSGIAAYERALELEPVHAIWWANLAAIYWSSDAVVSASEAMQQAVHYAPDFPDFWLNLGVYYEAQGLEDEARAAYKHVLDAGPQWAQAQFWQATALRRTVLAAYPVEPTDYIRAQLLAQQGDVDAAFDLLEAGVAHDPSQPGPYIRMARLAVELGMLEPAEHYLEAARLLVHADPDAAWIEFVDAELARARGQSDEAQTHREQARAFLWPDATGNSLLYGRDIAYYQFLRAKVQGTLLPQLIVLSPYPELVDLLEGSAGEHGR